MDLIKYVLNTYGTRNRKFNTVLCTLLQNLLLLRKFFNKIKTNCKYSVRYGFRICTLVQYFINPRFLNCRARTTVGSWSAYKRSFKTTTKFARGPFKRQNYQVAEYTVRCIRI